MNAKIYNGNVQPNPKEFKIWVNDEGTIKTWNGTKWIENTGADSGGSGSGSGNGEASTVGYYHIIKDYIGTESEFGDDVFVHWFITDHAKALDVSTGKYVNINPSFLAIIDPEGVKYNITDIMFVRGIYAVRDNNEDDAYIKYYDSFEEYLKQCAKRYGFTINPSDHIKSISYDEYWEGIDKTYTPPTDDGVPS